MLSKKWAVACTVVAMSALAACGESGGTTAADPTGGASGASGETMKIGVFGPEQIPQGEDVRDGAMLAAKELNAAGKGPKVEIVFCDSEAKPATAIACITKFAQQDKVQAITGGFSSAETLAVLDTVKRAKIPYVSAGAASPDVTKGVDSAGPGKYIFRIGPVNSLSLAADMCVTVVTKLTKEGFSKFGILHEDAAFALPLVKFLNACLVNPSASSGGKIPITTGVTVVGTEKHTPQATDFSAQFKSFTDKGADFVIEVNSTQVGIQLGKQWATLKPGFALGGINVSGQSSTYFAVTKAVGELNGPAGIVRAPVSPKTIPFFDAFETEYKRDPLYNGVATYDGVYALHEAAERAGSMKADGLVTELEKTDRIGAQGVEKFNESHDVIYSPNDPKAGLSLLYFQYQADGSKKIVYPASLAEGNTYQKPPGVK
ncbi:MAG: ABC transporter substrate-binding protein [Frankiales bacterium]|nr:ABC transporter substrate-binding protein [Frankiales bacterium]